MGKFFRPKTKKPPKFDDIKLRREYCRKKVHSNFQLNAISKAFVDITNLYDNINGFNPLTEEEEMKIFKEKNPDPLPVEDEVPTQTIIQQAFDPITIEEVFKAIEQAKRHKACGPSGIGPMHIKYIAAHHVGFIHSLTNIYNIMLTQPQRILPGSNFYKFEPIFIPKKKGGFRPICISE